MCPAAWAAAGRASTTRRAGGDRRLDRRGIHAPAGSARCRRAAAARTGSAAASARSSAGSPAGRRAAPARRRRCPSGPAAGRDDRSWPIVVDDASPIPVEHSDPAPWVGWTCTGSPSGSSVSWIEWYMSCAYGTAWSAPSRSVRPTAPTRIEPPLSSSPGSSGTDPSATRYDDVLRRVAGRVQHLEPQPPDIEPGAARPARRARSGAPPRPRSRASRRSARPGRGRPRRSRCGGASRRRGVIRRPRSRGRGQVDVDVAARIDDRGDPRVLVRDERRQVAEPADRRTTRVASATSSRGRRRPPAPGR